MSTRTTNRPRSMASRRPASRTNQVSTRRTWIISSIVLAGVVGLIAAMMWSARSTSDPTTRPAPDFSLTDTNGATIHLADLRGKNVVLYFNEGAGCQSCLLQMVDIERNASLFGNANVVVLPIVMNPAAQIKADMVANGVRTPFLLDDGTVSSAYGTLGKGMHAGLPGHSFVLIDAKGIQRWYGEYPSMYLPSSGLLEQIRTHLPG